MRCVSCCLCDYFVAASRSWYVDATIDSGTDDVFRRRHRVPDVPDRLHASPSGCTSHFAVRQWRLHRSISSMREISASDAAAATCLLEPADSRSWYVAATIDSGTDDVFRRRHRDFELPARLHASPSGCTSHFAVRQWRLHRSISSMREIWGRGGDWRWMRGSSSVNRRGHRNVDRRRVKDDEWQGEYRRDSLFALQLGVCPSTGSPANVYGQRPVGRFHNSRLQPWGWTIGETKKEKIKMVRQDAMARSAHKQPLHVRGRNTQYTHVH